MTLRVVFFILYFYCIYSYNLIQTVYILYVLLFIPSSIYVVHFNLKYTNVLMIRTIIWYSLGGFLGGETKGKDCEFQVEDFWKRLGQYYA